MSEESKVKMPDDEVIEMVKDFSPGLAKAVLETYQGMSYTVKNALNEVYACMGNVKGGESIAKLESALTKLKKACEANPEYEDLYSSAKEDANQMIAEEYANGGLSVG